jgi:5'(3')-deoxyribonucleotidase
MIIGLDLDAPTAEYYQGFRNFIALEEKIGTEAALERYPGPTTYEMTTWPGFPERFKDLHERAVAEGLYTKLEVIDGASEKLWKLSDEGHHIRVITSRFVVNRQHAKVITDTAVWLDDKNIPYRDICFVKTKGDIFADVYIDDAPENIITFQNLGRQVIIYDTPYNQDLEGLRAYNWDDVYEIIQFLNKNQ